MAPVEQIALDENAIHVDGVWRLSNHQLAVFTGPVY